MVARIRLRDPELVRDTQSARPRGRLGEATLPFPEIHFGNSLAAGNAPASKDNNRLQTELACLTSASLRDTHGTGY